MICDLCLEEHDRTFICPKCGRGNPDNFEARDYMIPKEKWGSKYNKEKSDKMWAMYEKRIAEGGSPDGKKNKFDNV